MSEQSTLARFNVLDPTDAKRQLAACLDVGRWVDDVEAGRPYAARRALLDAADRAARRLTDAEVESALAGHPRIGERARAGHNGEASAREQAAVDRSDAEVAARLLAGNAAYEERFDRVFLIRAAGRGAPEILAELERRLLNDDEAERTEVVDNLRQIALLRLEQVVWPMGTLSTHVLDTSLGRPAAGLAITLATVDGTDLARATTDADGRVGSLGPEVLDAGDYTLTFATGEYFAQSGVRGFYPHVTIAFTISDGSEHHHVPLLLNPYGYSTYRGS